MNNDAIVAALGDALRTRLGPAGRSLKMVAAGIGCSVDAIEKWLNGSRVPAWALVAMDDYFRRAGDRAFLAEVLRRPVEPAAPALGGGDLCWWVTADGEVIAAPHGHEAAARAALAVSDPGDVQWAAYAVRAAGWVGITLQADRRLVLRLSQARASTAAVARVCAWLPGPAGMLDSITLRMLSAAREWSVVDCDTIAATRRALDSVVGIGTAASTTTAMRISVERRALADQADGVTVAALRQWDGSMTGARRIIAAVADAGGAARAGLFHDRDGGFRCAALGGGLPIDPALKGRSIASLGEPDYVEMVSTHFRLTIDEARPTVHRIGIDAYGDHGTYDRFAAPVDDDGVPSILVVSQVIDPPRRVVLGQHGGRA